MTFKDLNLHENLQQGLQDIGFSEPTPIQEQSIPLLLEGKDVLGAAQTGTGKTGAFVIPIINQIINKPKDGIQALILSPTRELAQQIDEQIFALGYHTGITSATIIGGEDFSRQADAIRAGVDILVATPGRLIDQTKVLDVDFSTIKYLVLDEADRMLDMGFLPDVNHIIDKIPKKRQTLLFSATMPGSIKKLAQDIMNNPELVQIAVSTTTKSVTQKAYLIDGREKLKVVQNVLDTHEWKSCIIFTATKKGTDQLERLLSKKGLKVASIHGDRDQNERNKALHEFKNGHVPIIVATDVLARGIDIDDISLIINYDVPRAVEDYIHRIGRTGRYDKKGIAVTLVSKQDSKFFNAIERKVGKDLEVIKGGVKQAPKKESKKESGKEDRPNKDNSSDKKVKRKDINPDFSKLKYFTQSVNEEGKMVFTLIGKEKDKEEPKKQKSEQPKKQKQAKKKEAPRNKNNNSRNSERPKKSKKQSPRKPSVELKTVEKASERNVNSRRPAKGFWGVIKSMLPKFK